MLLPVFAAGPNQPFSDFLGRKHCNPIVAVCDSSFSVKQEAYVSSPRSLTLYVYHVIVEAHHPRTWGII
jgi:hypothetical protein